MNQPPTRRRLGLVAVVVVALFIALLARLWYLQVLSGHDFLQAAEANRIRVVHVEAPRGRILDRGGAVLADNRVSTVVSVDRSAYDDLEPDTAARLLHRVADELTRYGSPVEPGTLQERLDDTRHARHAPIPIASEVSEEAKIYIEEHLDQFPSISVDRVPVRRYPYGSRAAHVVGYVGQINDEELDARESKPKTYVPGNRIGKTGVERTFEDDLRGVPGRTAYEVDVKGRPRRILHDRSVPPVPGDDVWLTIDLETQALAEDLLAHGLEAARNRPVSGDNLPNRGNAGAVVVTDPRNGEVIAMASHPTFDPGDFVNGISPTIWAALNDESHDSPINNRALQGQYAPGSTFKLVTGYAAVVGGLRDRNQPFVDTGTYTLDDCTGRCTFRNAGSRAHGTVDLARSITVSSDAYFYAVGADFWNARSQLGEEALQESARLFGFGSQTGIPLASEADGRIPTPSQRNDQFDANPDLYAERNWYTGDNVNMAIGQGDVVVTPVQLANAYATFANGGVRYAPNIALRVTRSGTEGVVVRRIQPRVNGRPDLPPDLRASLLDGLVGATTAPGGTATSTFRGLSAGDYPVAGKTGTAQVDGKADTALFAAFAPAPAPDRQVVVVLEESGFGGVAAAPIGRALFDVFAGQTPAPSVEPGGRLRLPDGSSPPGDPGDHLEVGSVLQAIASGSED